MSDEYPCLREIEDKLIKDMLESSASTVSEPIEKTFDAFEEHCCKGGMTETWLIPGGSQFWLIFRGDPERFTWIEYCPYCGYRPANLRWDWNNQTKQEPYHSPWLKIDDTSPVKDAYFKVTLGKPCEFPTNNISTEYPNG